MPRMPRTVAASVLAATVVGTLGSSYTGAATAPAPACADETAPAGQPIVDDTAMATFGPLDAAPILDITLSSATLADARRVPGGVLVSAATGDESGWVALIEDSGAVRWKRCTTNPFVNPLVGPASSLPSVILLAEFSWDDVAGTPTTFVRAVDLASGADVATPTGIDNQGPGVVLLTSNEHVAVFGTGGSSLIDAGAETLVVVDLATMESTTIPMAPEADGRERELVNFTVSDEGVVAVEDPDRPLHTLTAYIGGNWQSDPAAIDAALPLWIDFFGGPITARTASGAAAWALSDMTDHGHEGFREATSDDITLIDGCIHIATEDQYCDEEALVGVVTATGQELWRLHGSRTVVAAGNGFALVNEEWDGSAENSPDMVMIDTVTGTNVAGQRWPGGTFVVGCCGDPAFTARAGGVVMTGDDTNLRVYVPLGIGGPTATVTL